LTIDDGAQKRRPSRVDEKTEVEMLRSLSLAALLAGAIVISGAKAEDSPAMLGGAKVVAAEEVAKAQAAGAAVIDVRVASEYAEGHIKGAVNVPYREKSKKAANFDAAQDEFNLAKLPADKATPVVIYCNGPECWKSFKASSAAIKDGRSNVLWYRLGFPEWKAKGQSIE
jgi:rhodanese-related sulfurtransferase